MAHINLLFFGDVVGQPGRRALRQELSKLQEQFKADVTIVNGENSAGGRGITPKIAKSLFAAGTDVITTGDHVWDQHELMAYLDKEPRILRPLNYPAGTVGSGCVILDYPFGKVAILNAQGRTFMQPPLENPFVLVSQQVEALRAQGIHIIFLDFHAETTSEMIGMGRCLDGLASGVVGTHTHVQTADESIFPNGTGYLTDAGMCGPIESILGREIKPVVRRFKTALHEKFPVAKGPVLLCGVCITVDSQTGKAVAIERIQHRVENWHLQP